MAMLRRMCLICIAEEVWKNMKNSAGGEERIVMKNFFRRCVELLVYIPYSPAPSSFKDLNRSGKQVSTQD